MIQELNLTQMKLMKVIYRMRNVIIQDFQHSVQFQMIEVMEWKRCF
jgi:hypothetical protein